MSNIHGIKLRIKGIRETRKITRAMKLISAAKLKKARLQLEAALPYFERVKCTIADILAHSASVESRYFGTEDPFEKYTGTAQFVVAAVPAGNAYPPGTVHPPRTAHPPGKRGYVVFSGDKGLAGGYNYNILKFAEKLMSESPDPLVLSAGRKGGGHFSARGYELVQGFNYLVDNPTVARAGEMSRTVLSLFDSMSLSEVYLVYTTMVSASRLEPRKLRLLPLDAVSLCEGPAGGDGAGQSGGAAGAVHGEGQGTGAGRDDGKGCSRDDGIVYEPSAAAVLEALVPMYLTGVIYGALVEAFTSEQCARMTAMDNATSNADDMLQSLNLQYNRARQAVITQEISEIVGGAATVG